MMALIADAETCRHASPEAVLLPIESITSIRNVSFGSKVAELMPIGKIIALTCSGTFEASFACNYLRKQQSACRMFESITRNFQPTSMFEFRILGDQAAAGSFSKRSGLI